MPVLLSDRMQSAIHRLLMAEPEVGVLLPSSALEALGALIGCDWYGICEADNTGYRLRGVGFPPSDLGDPQVCDGPLLTGIVHDAERPTDERYAAHFGSRDFLWLGFSTRSGTTVTQLVYDRRRNDFAEQDLAVLRMVEPAIGKLVRQGARDAPNGSLTASERRVLGLVAAGASNREVAEELYVTVHTVRKHLENAYRKLGVTNRTAAALMLRSA